jgi:BirA family biotin operon repressor/biotin-[acetyl-CoA-carboxylase] ligase
LKGYVLGMGVNLNMTDRELESIDRPATSVNLITGKEVDRGLFLDGLLQAFFEGYEGFLAGGFSTIRDDYVKRCSFLGKRVAVRVSDRTCSGTALSFSKGGALVMRADTGETLTLTAGEVSLLRPSS